MKLCDECFQFMKAKGSLVEAHESGGVYSTGYHEFFCVKCEKTFHTTQWLEEQVADAQAAIAKGVTPDTFQLLCREVCNMLHELKERAGRARAAAARTT